MNRVPHGGSARIRYHEWPEMGSLEFWLGLMVIVILVGVLVWAFSDRDDQDNGR